MPDMLVNLYQLPDSTEIMKKMEEEGIRIIRALSPDMHKVLDFIEQEFGKGWRSEVTGSFFQTPISCYIAVKDREIIGFACYDGTARGYFGPTGVKESLRGKGIGQALLLKCLEGQKEVGYGYSIIGWAGPVGFYERFCNAKVIPDDRPNVYSRLA